MFLGCLKVVEGGQERSVSLGHIYEVWEDVCG